MPSERSDAAEPRAADDGSAASAILRIGGHSDPLSLDPHFKNEVLTFSVLLNICEPLVRIDEHGRVEPSLALRWENPDERRWHFHLRPGVRFHDGRPLTAADVVASIERAKTHEDSQMSSYVVELEQVRQLSDTVVEVTTARPYPILLNKLAFIFIAPAGAPAESSSRSAPALIDSASSSLASTSSYDASTTIGASPQPSEWPAIYRSRIPCVASSCSSTARST